MEGRHRRAARPPTAALQRPVPTAPHSSPLTKAISKVISKGRAWAGLRPQAAAFHRPADPKALPPATGLRVALPGHTAHHLPRPGLTAEAPARTGPSPALTPTL